MKKLGRPRTRKDDVQHRLSVSFTEEAAQILNLVKDGKKSELISLLITAYAPQFPAYFVKKEKK